MPDSPSQIRIIESCSASILAPRWNRFASWCRAPAGNYIVTATIAAGTVVAKSGWTSAGPEGGSIQALAIDPTNPNILYAATSGSGAFKSTDAGNTWREINTGLGLDGSFVRTLALDPVNPSTLYAGTASGVFLSTDQGVTWKPRSTGLPDTRVEALAIDPGNTSILYAGTLEGVFQSSDQGATWVESSNGLTNTRVSWSGERAKCCDVHSMLESSTPKSAKPRTMSTIS